MTDLKPYDLQAPDRMLVPDFQPLRYPSREQAAPRYKPQPLAPGMARVVLAGGGYDSETGFSDYDEAGTYAPGVVFDVPQDQRDRWSAAAGAWQQAQDEIYAMLYPPRDGR